MTRKLSVLVVGVLALGAVACGQQPRDAAVAVDAGLDAHALAASADQTAKAGTAKVHLSITAEASSGATGSMPSMSGDGAYDTASGRSTMNMDLGSTLTGTVDLVQDGDVAYLRMSTLDRVIPSLSGRWLKVDAAESKALGRSTGPLTGANGVGDPSAVLDYLKGAGADLSTVGHEEVGGVDTTHVHATISAQQALEASAADRAKVEQSLEKLAGKGEALASLTFPIDVFVDGDGYVRRIAVELEGPASLGTKMLVTLDYSDFGQRVAITVPAAADTTDICALDAARPAGRSMTPTLPAGVC